MNKSLVFYFFESRCTLSAYDIDLMSVTDGQTDGRTEFRGICFVQRDSRNGDNRELNEKDLRILSCTHFAAEALAKASILAVVFC